MFDLHNKSIIQNGKKVKHKFQFLGHKKSCRFLTDVSYFSTKGIFPKYKRADESGRRELRPRCSGRGEDAAGRRIMSVRGQAY